MEGGREGGEGREVGEGGRGGYEGGRVGGREEGGREGGEGEGREGMVTIIQCSIDTTIFK